MRAIRTLSLVFASLLTAACASEPGTIGEDESELTCAGSCVGGSLSGDALLTPVSRRVGLRPDWAPQTIPLPERYYTGAVWRLRPEAHAAFVKMVKAAWDQDKVDLYCMSGYRSFDTQCQLFASYAAREGCEAANTYSAHAGHSEHQLGTVCDIALGDYVAAGQPSPFVQAGDAGDRWLRAHAHEYGFACSYPNPSRADNDGYIHEPWHYRYVGVAAAAEIRRRGSPAIPVFIASLSAEERAALEGASGGGAVEDEAPSGCRGFDAVGACTGTVLEWCEGGVYKRVDCATKTDGRTACGPDPNPALGNNCVRP